MAVPIEDVPVVVKFQPPGDNVQFRKGCVGNNPAVSVRTSHKISGADWLWAGVENVTENKRARNKYFLSIEHESDLGNQKNLIDYLLTTENY
ncbi:MAG: hypothetical protein SGJ02_01005 [bacterium]|nr:hypothetical protein [bacterium]